MFAPSPPALAARTNPSALLIISQLGRVYPGLPRIHAAPPRDRLLGHAITLGADAPRLPRQAPLCFLKAASWLPPAKGSASSLWSLTPNPQTLNPWVFVPRRGGPESCVRRQPVCVDPEAHNWSLKVGVRLGSPSPDNWLMDFCVVGTGLGDAGASPCPCHPFPPTHCHPILGLQPFCCCIFLKGQPPGL